MTGVWRGPHRREQLVRQAISALYQFQRDKHYLVRDDKVVIIDENTGRLMPDRSWEQGLHQLIEIKEELRRSPAAARPWRASATSVFSAATSTCRE